MRREIIIPKSYGGTIFIWVITAVVVLFVILAVENFFGGVGMIPSGLWLALVAYMVWTDSKDEGGLQMWATKGLAELAGKPFIEHAPDGSDANEICFGFKLFGRRIAQCTIALDQIESVEWSSGQASSIARRDMNDWHVCLWFDHNDPKKKLQKRNWPKPNQDILIVGPSRRKELTVAFGLAFIAFLNDSGAELVQGDNDTCFVRSGSVHRIAESHTD